MPFLTDNLGRVKGRIDSSGNEEQAFDKLGRYKTFFRRSSTTIEPVSSAKRPQKPILFLGIKDRTRAFSLQLLYIASASSLIVFP